MTVSALPRAPGARAAKTSGILAIAFALTCIGFPIAIILGITALVQQAKAKRLVKAQPGTYAPVTPTGLVTGIIGLVLPFFMLPIVGIASAIAIPAFLGQRGRARDKAAMSNMIGTMPDLVEEYDRLVPIFLGLLKDANRLIVSGSGDPFASRHFRRVLRAIGG